MQQQILHPAMTIRTEGGQQSVELTTPGALVTITADTLSVMTQTKMQVIRWEDLIEMLDDLADVDENAQILPVVFDPLAWLLSRPGVVHAHRNDRHGFLLIDDYDTETTLYTA